MSDVLDGGLRMIEGEHLDVREPVGGPLTPAQFGAPEPPRPLTRVLGPPDEFPVGALGDVLAPATEAIHERTQAPLAICGQSVLAAATLVVQAHADIELPTGQKRPLTNFFLTVAGTGERKTAVDNAALAAVRLYEASLRSAYSLDGPEFEKSHLAWEKARDFACKSGKGDCDHIKAALDALGPSPVPPLVPLLVCPEPTYEGMCRLLATGQPSIGIFASEGGQFIGGHGMADEAKLRTATGLSAIWDGEPIKRVRAGDGVSVLPGRRVTMHLMAQPNVAATLLGDRMLIDQGLLSRFLTTAPAAASGTRMWRERKSDSDRSVAQYEARLLDILRLRLPLAAGSRNELTPRTLQMSADARRLWIAFYNHVEERVCAGGELEPVVGLANKLPEHAARLAAVITLVNQINSTEIGPQEMSSGIKLAQHFASEALRLFGASRTSEGLREAERLRHWLETLPQELISLPDIYQFGPSSIRDAAAARRATNVLVEHGWLIPLPPGTVKGRREVWHIVRE